MLSSEVSNRVFISRQLKEDSIFRQQLTAAGYPVIGESLVVFQAVPFEWNAHADWLFFYSRHAVQFFFEQIGSTDQLSELQIAAMGQGTAAAISRYSFQADFIGSGEPEAVAAAFEKVAAGQAVIFPRAQQSRRSIQQLLAGRIQSSDIVVYDNQHRTDLNLPHCQALVFTSPMNAEAYFRRYELKDTQRVYAIGQVSARRLRQLGVAEVAVAAQPSEEALVRLVIEDLRSGEE